VRLVFAYDAAAALADADVRAEAQTPEATAVIRAWAEELAGCGPLLDRQTFREAAKRTGARAGAKGKALFHSIRLALTGAPDGPELDVLVPAIDTAAALTPADGVAPVMSCHERAVAFAAALGAA
jgi:hypothetical protein